MSASSVPAWITILSALLTPAIAILTSLIAFQQWRTNRNKLKLNLFDRRYVYYEAARELLGCISVSGKVTEQVMFEFHRKTRGAQFIVGDSIARYFDQELYSKANDLKCLYAELECVEVGPDRNENLRNQKEIKKWFYDQSKVLDKLFRPLLDLKH